MTTKSQYADLLAELNTINKQNKLAIYVPSQQKYIDFTPLTVHHQKKIITTAISDTLNVSTFHLLINSIINECCTEKQKLYLIDRDAIMIGLRGYMLGYKTTGKNSAGKDVDLDFEDHCNNFKNIKLPSELLSTTTVEYDGIAIEIESPTLDIDTAVSKKVSPVINKMMKDDNINDTIGESIIYELTKYIKSISISGTTMRFKHSEVIKLAKVIESLPLKISKMIMNEIENTSGHIGKFTTIESESGNITIPVDARFFNGE
jgi:hypothetical protein